VIVYLFVSWATARGYLQFRRAADCFFCEQKIVVARKLEVVFSRADAGALFLILAIVAYGLVGLI